MALSVEQQLALFKALLSESPYELTVAQEDIEKAFLKAVTMGQKHTVVTEKKTKKKSGYTLFLSENMGKDKMSMGEAVGSWKVLPQEKKDEWNLKAKASQIPSEVEVVVKKPKKKSGYTVFLSEKMGVEKMKMGEAVGAWKVLPQEKKDEYNAKAKAM